MDTFKLYMYNPALGENYLVVPSNNPISLSQNDNESNMIWEYSLNLTIIAPMERVRKNAGANAAAVLLAADVMQKGVNDAADTIKKSIL